MWGSASAAMPAPVSSTLSTAPPSVPAAVIVTAGFRRGIISDIEETTRSIAQALGCMGRGEDVDAIAGSLDTLNDPDLQAMAATALGFHASYDALRKLADIVRSKDSSSVRRAAAIEGAGMALGRAAPLALMDVGRDSNYTVFNEWGTGLYRTTL